MTDYRCPSHRALESRPFVFPGHARAGLVDKEMVFHLMGGYWGIWLWEKYGDVIKFLREYNNMPELATWFEYLAMEMTNIREQRGSAGDVPEAWGAVKLDAT